jgi:alpha-N-arabinofuranosidase
MEAFSMNRIIINADFGQHIISRHLYGHFAEHLGRCIYDGIWVGENSPIPNTRGIRNDIVEALRRIKVPNLRWPGGCFADDYHWKDGIGPKEQRPRTINLWGYVIENNHFGTHEFMDLCDQLGCEPYFCGNVGSGTEQEMEQWVEYLTFDGDSSMANLRRQNGREEPWKVPFWGVGNENWGCGGHMRPEYYADLYFRYQTFIRRYGDNPLMKIAGGYGGSDTTGKGLEMFFQHIPSQLLHMIEGVSLHYYVYLPQRKEHSATQFGEREWFEVLKYAAEIEGAIERHANVLDRYDPDKRIWLIVDEWGAWYPVEPGTNPAFLYQQNSLRDALVAALTLHIFHAHGDRVRMANLAQIVNVIQSVILTDGDKMILTPTYHVFDMFKVHQDATFLPLNLECDDYSFEGNTLPAVSASASRDQDGHVHLTLCNLDPHKDLDVSCELRGMQASTITGEVLTAREMNAHNTFDKPDVVHPATFDGARLQDGKLMIRLPAKSVVALTID